MVPDLCTVNVDIRLTPALDDPAAVALLRAAAADTDAAWPGTPPTGVEVTTRWPPYALPDGSPLRDALLAGRGPGGAGPGREGRRAVQHRQLPRRAGHPCHRRVRRRLRGPARHRRAHPPRLDPGRPGRLPSGAAHPSATRLTGHQSFWNVPFALSWLRQILAADIPAARKTKLRFC